MYVMVAGQLRSSVTITECLPSIRVLKIADLTNNAHSEVLWLTEVIHAQLKRSAPWTLFKFTYKCWSISMYSCLHTLGERKGFGAHKRHGFTQIGENIFHGFIEFHMSTGHWIQTLLACWEQTLYFGNVMTSRVACSTCYWNGGLAHRWKSTCCHEANVWPTSQF